MSRNKSTGKLDNSVADKAGGSRSRGAERDRVRHLRFETLEDRLLLSAGPTAVGPEFQVNTSSVVGATTPGVASDAAGDYVIVWDQPQSTTDGNGEIDAQRYDASGAAEGSVLQVDTNSADNDAHPVVAMDPTGDFVVAWESANEGSAIIQRFNAAGVAQGSQIDIGGLTSRPLSPVAIAMDASGDFVLAYYYYDDSTYEDPADGYYAQPYDTSGNAVGNAFKIGPRSITGSTNLPDDAATSIATDSAGDVLAVGANWTNYQTDGYPYDGYQFGVYSQRYEAASQAEGSATIVNSYTSYNQFKPTVAMDAQGDYVVAWTSQYQDGSGYGVFAQRFDAAGAPQGSEFQVNTYTTGNQIVSSAAMDESGDFVIVWASYGQGGSQDGIFAQAYNASGVPAGSEFQVNSISSGSHTDASVAMDSAGDFVIAWQDNAAPGYSLADATQFSIHAQRYSGGFSGSQAGTLTINGANVSGPLELQFTGPTTFDVEYNGATNSYSTSTISKVVFNGTSGQSSQVIFYDPFSTDAYSATQTLDATDIVRTGGTSFEFDVNNAAGFYAYVADPASTAAVSVSGTGNYYVDAADAGYSYIADPTNEIYSELSGFGSQTVSGSGSSTYAYVYSRSHASFVGDPGGNTLTVGGVTSTLTSFPQLYVVGASDGTDSLTLHTDGGGFIGTPGFAYVSGTFNGQPFLIGGLYAALVTAQATNSTDSAFFYSYPGNVFAGSVGTSSLTSSAIGIANFANFVAQATGFQSVTDEQSGDPTDVANLTAPSNAVFISTPTVSTLSVAGVTVLTVITSYNNDGTFVAVPSEVTITGNTNGSDTANLYDDVGSNALVVQGSSVMLTRPTNRVMVSQFGNVLAFQTQGTDDTVHQQAIDYALQLIGNWTSD